MEMMSEQERFQNRILSRDITFSEAILALQALIKLAGYVPAEAEDNLCDGSG